VLLSRFSEPLERYERNLLRASEEDSKMIQLFVTLVRNLLFGATMCQAHGISDDGHLKVVSLSIRGCGGFSNN